jgi:hypothetical protein
VVTESVPRAASSILGIAPTVLEPLGTIHHSITRYRIRLEVYRASGVGGDGAWRETSETKWLTPRQLAQLPFASAHRKILRQWLSLGERSTL